MISLQRKTQAKYSKPRKEIFQYAIDKEALNSAVNEGYGEVATSIITKAAFGYTEIPTEYNLEKAKELMAEAGYPDGFDIECVVQNTQTYTLTGQILQEMLAEININLTIETVDFATTQSYKLEPDHELYISNWVTVGDAYTTWNPWYRSDATAAEGNNAFVKEAYTGGE